MTKARQSLQLPPRKPQLRKNFKTRVIILAPVGSHEVALQYGHVNPEFGSAYNKTPHTPGQLTCQPQPSMQRLEAQNQKIPVYSPVSPGGLPLWLDRETSHRLRGFFINGVWVFSFVLSSSFSLSSVFFPFLHSYSHLSTVSPCVSRLSTPFTSTITKQQRPILQQST